jgi:transcriptional regulator with XRE-family HTH domain
MTQVDGIWATSTVKKTTNELSPLFWLKRLRDLKGMTLEQLAFHTDLTESFLSKLERGLSVPSIATAFKLAHAFDVSIDELIGGGTLKNDCVVVRKNQRKPFSERTGDRAGYCYEVMDAAATRGIFEGFVMQPPFGAQTEQHRFQHLGQEMVYVLSGKVEISFPHRTVSLLGGDAIVFGGRLPHRCVSIGSRLAEVLVIVTS